jgi:dihydroorotate dehydrogenase (fumarate)
MRAKAALDIPVIASLNGTSAGGWTRFARFMQDAGADALELNLYHVASDPVRSSADIEAGYLDLVRAVARAIRIPFAVKLGPDFTGLAHFAAAASLSGADGLVLFNRFYQPDIDLERLEVIPGLEPSRSSELPQRLRWIAMLHGRIDADLAVTGGVHTGEDVLKCVMAGASIAMMTSALLVRGIGHLHTVLRDMKAWMVQSEYESIAGMRGSMSHRSVARPSALERANYMRALQSYTVPGRSG